MNVFIYVRFTGGFGMTTLQRGVVGGDRMEMFVDLQYEETNRTSVSGALVMFAGAYMMYFRISQGRIRGSR